VPSIGRFASADTLVPDPANPQSWNRYSYVNNQPLVYNDPTGHWLESAWDALNVGMGIASFVDNVKQGNYGWAAVDALGVVVDTAALVTPIVPGGVSAIIKGTRVADTAVDAIQTVNQVSNAAQTANQAANVAQVSTSATNRADEAIYLFSYRGKPDVPATRPGVDNKVSCNCLSPAEGFQVVTGRSPGPNDYYWRVDVNAVQANGGRIDFDDGQPVTRFPSGEPLGSTYPRGHVSISFPDLNKSQIEKNMRNLISGPYGVR
jgi:hypothetical protein